MDPDDLLKPREVADLFGVRPTTIAQWARDGKLTPLRTPGGQRRYPMAAIRGLIAQTPQEDLDAVRLYDQGWNIRQVAQRFGVTYGVMRRILSNHTTLRHRGGRPPHRT